MDSAVEIDDAQTPKNEYVHHVTYLAMLAIVTSLIAEQAFKTRSLATQTNETVTVILTFTYAITYWTAFFSVVTSIASGLASLLTHRRPRICSPTILFFITMFFWLIYRILFTASDILSGHEQSRYNELTAYMIPTGFIVLSSPCFIAPLFSGLRIPPKFRN